MNREIPTRYKAYVELFEDWIRPLEPGDGLSNSEIEAAEFKLGFKLPLALKELYGLVGNSLETLNRQNFLLSPEAIEVRGGQVIFYVENQGCCDWTFQITDSKEDDPIVWMDGKIQAAEKLSDFVFGMMIIEATFRGPGGMGTLEEADLPGFCNQYSDLGIKAQINGQKSFFYDRDALLFMCRETNGDLFVFAHARAAKARKKLLAFEAISWWDEPGVIG